MILMKASRRLTEAADLDAYQRYSAVVIILS